MGDYFVDCGFALESTELPIDGLILFAVGVVCLGEDGAEGGLAWGVEPEFIGAHFGEFPFESGGASLVAEIEALR